jgi:hypothetical protein
LLFVSVLQNAGTRPPRPSHPPRPPFGRRSPPVSRPAVSGGGQTWRWVRGWCFALCVGFAECGNTPPRLRRCPPGLVGFLLGVVQNMKTCPPRLASLGAAPQNGGRSGEDLGVEVRVWRPHETHRSSRSSRTQNTDAQEATCSPHSGGQRRASARRGGHVLALCATYNKKPTSGGQRRRRGGLVTRPARPTTSHPASQKPRTRRQVCPPPEHEV